MKGITHFISGIAVATFIPDAVQSAAGGSLILALGGVFGILPDTLDFKFARFMEKYDDEIDPNPYDLEPQAIAERIARAMQTAFERKQPQTIMLHTIRLGADLWREYSLRFSSETNEIVVRIGPMVNTSQAPLPGSRPQENIEGRAIASAPMMYTYDAESKINIFSGPAFRFERVDDQIHVSFLPWHRRWSHSLTLSAAIGLLMGLLLGPTAGLVCGLGFATHVLQDQLGFMGSNLLWPLTRERTTGFKLLHSGDGLPNFLGVCLAVALILFNLDRFSAEPRLAAWPYLLSSVLLPLLVLGGFYAWERHKGTARPVEAQRQGDILSEAEEIEL